MLISKSASKGLVDFSLNIYDRKNVKETLLILQDEFSCNVLSILWFLWVDLSGIELSIEQQHKGELRIDELSAQVLKSVRQSRYELNGSEYLSRHKKSIKSQLVAIEIECEIAILGEMQAFTESQITNLTLVNDKNRLISFKTLDCYIDRRCKVLKKGTFMNDGVKQRFMALFNTLKLA